jgi:hypothetical protein
LRGNNLETFRLYEALDAGCIPLFIDDDLMSPFSKCITNSLKIRGFNNITDLKEFINYCLSNPDTFAENYRIECLNAWETLKQLVKTSVQRFI